jgi:hypothetical protein
VKLNINQEEKFTFEEEKDVDVEDLSPDVRESKTKLVRSLENH